MAVNHGEDSRDWTLRVLCAARDDALAVILEIHPHGVKRFHDPARLCCGGCVIHAVDQHCAPDAGIDLAMNDRKIDTRYDLGRSTEIADLLGKHRGHLVVAACFSGHRWLPNKTLQACNVVFEMRLSRV